MSDFIVHANNRAVSRRTVRLGCEVVRVRDYQLIGKKMVDFSTDGIQVLAEDEATLHEDVEIFFRVPYSNVHLLAEGHVARVIRGKRMGDEGPSYGIMLGGLHPEVMSALKCAQYRFPPTMRWRPRRVDYAATVRAIAYT